MATEVLLRHRETGRVTKAYTGFSWTTAVFGPFPALFRSDYITFLVYFCIVAVVVVLSGGLGVPIAIGAQIVWACMYNAHHMQKLVEGGYVLDGADVTNVEAQQSTKMSSSAIGLRPEPADISNDAYKIYLVRKYKIERNEALQKVIVENRLFESIEDALAFADAHDKATLPVPPIEARNEKWRMRHTVRNTTLSQGLRIYWLDNGTVAIDGCDDTFQSIGDAKVSAMVGP